VNNIGIQAAELNWNEQGTPVSKQFDDVYFSNHDGLQETRHVFLQGNKLAERWINHPRPLFVIAETGFGTGLNFLALWQQFAAYRQSSPTGAVKRLHVISIEKYPLQSADLAVAQAQWPELAPFAAELRSQWPELLAGCHRLLLADGQITLDLWFGDVNAVLPQFDHSMNHCVDAWFLDGFAPSKNPEMWSEQLFSSMARLVRPEGTLSTFTVAGVVRRGLQQAGFVVERIKGFGQKKQMLSGYLPADHHSPHPAPWYQRPAASNTEDIAIIGGGIASALLALSLLRRGAKVHLYCADDAPAQGASGNRQGAVYPLLNGSNNELERFFCAAFPFAQRYYQQLSATGVDFDHQWCGVSQIGYDAKSQSKIDSILSADWPPSFVVGLSAEALTAACGVSCAFSGLSYPQGGWVNPGQLTQALIRQAEQLGLQCHYQHRLTTLDYRDQQWQLSFEQQATQRHSTVILANGHTLAQLPQTATLAVYGVRGQVSHIPTTPALTPLKQVLCYDGYLTPVNPATQQHCIGASYQRGDLQTDYRQDEQQQNRDRLVACLPNEAWPQTVDISDQQARQGIRCATRDHIPMVGAVADYAVTLATYQDLPQQRQQGTEIISAPVHPDLFMLGALGSRGLSSAPLAAEILASQIFAEPLPLDSETLAALNPNRLWVRKLLKGRAV